MTTLVGIIGFGRIGAEHAGWINHSQSARAVAIADATPARREMAAGLGLRAVENADELLNDPSIDAILVSLPTSMHFEYASRALNAGKHVMVEKPMALNLDEAQKLIEMARVEDRVLSVFHNRRWDVDFLTVRNAVESGVFGRLINVESRLCQWASCVGPAAKEWRPGWRNEASYGGGGLYDWGSHFLDQMQLLMRPARPIRVFAQLRGNVWSRDCDDFARVCIDFDNGAAALIEINTTTTRNLPRWHIDGTLGSADSPQSDRYDTNEWARLLFQPADGNPAHLLPMDTTGIKNSMIWDEFSAACQGEGKPAVTVESVLPTMTLLDAVIRSGVGKQSVQIDI
jgi:predicted dehydrogenase